MLPCRWLKEDLSWPVKRPTFANATVDGSEILPTTWHWDIYHINWLVWFLASTVWRVFLASKRRALGLSEVLKCCTITPEKKMQWKKKHLNIPGSSNSGDVWTRRDGIFWYPLLSIQHPNWKIQGCISMAKRCSFWIWRLCLHCGCIRNTIHGTCIFTYMNGGCIW